MSRLARAKGRCEPRKRGFLNSPIARRGHDEIPIFEATLGGRWLHSQCHLRPAARRGCSTQTRSRPLPSRRSGGPENKSSISADMDGKAMKKVTGTRSGVGATCSRS
jgi:hypothetical protein